MLVLLDRDGVINRDYDEGVLRLADFQFMPRALDGLKLLREAGAKVAVCTNQSAVGRGAMTQAELDRIHAHMREEVEKAGGRIDRVYFAPDKPEGASDRRKPGPGMLREALHDFAREAAQTFFVGDMLRDMEAAHRAGCPFILVRCGKGARTLAQGIPESFTPTAVCDDLFAAAQFILAHRARSG